MNECIACQIAVSSVEKNKAGKGDREDRGEKMAFTLNKVVKECITD